MEKVTPMAEYGWLPGISECNTGCYHMKTVLCFLFGTVVCACAYACMMRPCLWLQGSCSLTLFVQWPLPYFVTAFRCPSTGSELWHAFTTHSYKWSLKPHDFPHREFLSGIVHAHEVYHSLLLSCVWYFWFVIFETASCSHGMTNFPVKLIQCT